jgi:hypothetical protein
MAKSEAVSYVLVLLIFRDQIELQAEMAAGSPGVRGYSYGAA